MKVLVDTDVLLDVALAREKFVKHSAEVLRWCEYSGSGVIAWHSVANCSYLLKNAGRPFLDRLLEIVTVADVGHDDALLAMRLNMPDLEDALQSATACSAKADLIITRNIKHYKNSPIPACTPHNFLVEIRN